MREKIFVSYSHKDKVWLDRLKEHLGAGICKKAFEMWSDLDIENGADWKQQIQAAIASSRIALLLVSKHFLASDFIVDDELTSILRLNESNEAGRPEGLTIWWVPIEKITAEELQIAGIGSIQAAVASPSRPLGQLKSKELEDAIRKLSSKLLKQLKLLHGCQRRCARSIYDRGDQSTWQRQHHDRGGVGAGRLFDPLPGEEVRRRGGG